MENNNPGDSSSESDISDPWSIIDRESCEPFDTQGENSGRNSISGDPSDGESLEVIDEDRHDDEYKDAGMETDGVSIITDSEINEELEHPLSLAVNKEKKYLHHPNTYLNTRLNVLLAISLAAVTGLGLGHFIGLQEECPILNESTNSLLEKLQHENEILRVQLNQLLKEKSMSTRFGEPEPKQNNYGNLYLHPTSESKGKKEGTHLSNQGVNSEKDQTESKLLGYELYSEIISRPIYGGALLNLIHENRDIEHTGKSNVVIDVDQQDGADSDYGAVIASDLNSARKDSLQLNYDIKAVNNIENEEKNVQLNNEFKYSSTVQMDTEDENPSINSDVSDDDNFLIDISDEEVISTSPVILPDNENFVENENVNIGVFTYPSNENDNEIHTPGPDEEKISEQIIRDETHKQQNYMFADSIKETNGWEEHNLELIKSTLELLKMHFDNDAISPDTENILFSAIKLAAEYEQSQVQLQNTISNCKIKKNDFCVQFLNKMEVSINKLKETSEELAEDIDEQMFKLLSKIVRKLGKFKGNVQNKWCHLKSKYNGMNGWLQSSVLLDCKENKRRDREGHRDYHSKTPEMLHDKIITNSVKSTITENLSAENIMKTGNKNKDNKYRHDKIEKPNSNEEKYSKTFQNSWQENKHDREVYKKDKYRKEEKTKYYCQQNDNGKSYCKDKKDNQESSEKFKPHFAKYNWDGEKKIWKDQEIKKDKREHMKRETKPYWQNNNNNKNYGYNIILDQNGSWLSVDPNPSKQHNISGDWILKMANGRAEQRKLNHKSDWLFDRADARKTKREKGHKKDNWYFQRVSGREYCRYYSNSDWCKTEHYREANQDWRPQDRYENEKGGKLHYDSRWSKKFIPRAFATAGKWVKDSFANFENKMNYYYHSHR